MAYDNPGGLKGPKGSRRSFDHQASYTGNVGHRPGCEIYEHEAAPVNNGKVRGHVCVNQESRRNRKSK